MDSLKKDVVKYTTILLVVHILTKKRDKQRLFDSKSVQKIGYWIAGILMFYYIVEPFVIGKIIAPVPAPVAA